MDDKSWFEMTQDEKNAWVKRESEYVLWLLDMLSAGLAVRHGGLIYFLPLCHDAYGENI